MFKLLKRAFQAIDRRYERQDGDWLRNAVVIDFPEGHAVFVEDESEFEESRRRLLKNA